MTTYTADEARRIIADAGFIARVAASGLGLIVYEGEEDRPSAWTEISRIAFQDGKVASGALSQFAA